MREDHWRELVYTAREVSGVEAQAIGLVTRVALDPIAEATTLAHEIAGKSGAAIRAAKRLADAMCNSTATQLLQSESDEQQVLVDMMIGKAPTQ